MVAWLAGVSVRQAGQRLSVMLDEKIAWFSRGATSLHRVDRKRLVRNRWQLAFMLLVNPTLRQYRGGSAGSASRAAAADQQQQRQPPQRVHVADEGEASESFDPAYI